MCIMVIVTSSTTGDYRWRGAKSKAPRGIRNWRQPAFNNCFHVKAGCHLNTI